MIYDPLTRRRLFGTGAAAGAGVLLGGPVAADAARLRRSRTVDVAIVGAGFAGLTAARELVRAGRSVVVLEARHRVGGRVVNKDLGDGDESERGGTFAGPTQNHVLALAKDMGVDTFLTYNEGDNIYYVDGERSRYNDQSPFGTAPPDPQSAADVAQVVVRLDEMSKEVPVDAPWEAASAAAWDGQTLEEWLAQNSSPSPRFHRLVAAGATRPIWGVEPREVSFLFVLFYVAASGDEQHIGTFERNFNTRDGAQERRFVGGSQVICERVAKRLGKRVVLGSPVSRIVQEKGRVRVESKLMTVRARRAILALPPALTPFIRFSPALPAQRVGLARHLPQGTLWKVAAVYDRPFWRDDGLTGFVVSLNGPVTVAVDDSPPDGRPGVVFGFVGGDEARSFARMSRAARRTAVLKNFTDFFGSKAASPRDYFETNWPRERWSRGGPVGVPPAGALVPYGPVLRKPFGRLHWAGTETSTYWNGYMDGAVRSGKRAALEVLDQL